MKSVYNFLISPLNSNRYNNVKKIGDKELILNTDIFSHEHVNRLAKVISTPLLNNTDIKLNDTIIVHHNVFRRYNDVRGEEKDSKSYIDEDLYSVDESQIFMYKRGDWKCLDGYCFVKPIKPYSKLTVEKEEPLIGIVKYTDGSFEEKDLIGFTPNSEYEFVIGNHRLYRIRNKDITIKYEYKGKEKEYNPSWLQSC